MSRWVDADALIESIKNTADLGGWIGAAVYHIKQVAIKYIDDAPSIDIVLCSECKYWNHETDLTYCDRTVWFGTDANDHCSFGERRK